MRDRRPRVTPGSLFWPMVDRGHPMECWPFRGWHRPGSYAYTVWEGRRIYAHRLAWLVAGRMLIPGLVIMHKCDNPPCCNPAHLRQGTQADNIRDSVIK